MWEPRPVTGIALLLYSKQIKARGRLKLVRKRATEAARPPARAHSNSLEGALYVAVT
jgi:hypothetical protein